MSKPLRLLLIEDSEDDALLLVANLERGDYDVALERVYTASGMRSALTDRKWDIIISDYSMPQFNGLQALEIAKELAPRLPFVMVSGAIGEERAAEIMRKGASDYIMKGNLSRLVPAIERELEEIARHEASEQQVNILSRALAQSTNLVVITNTLDDIIYANKTFSGMTGYTFAEIEGKPSHYIFSDDNENKLIGDFYDAIHQGRSWRGEVLVTKADKSTFWADLNGTVIRDMNGNVGQFLLVLDDITERKNMATELANYTENLERMVEDRTSKLKRAKEQMEAILNNSSDGIVLALSSGDIQTVNPAFHTLFENRINQSVEEILHTVATERDMRDLSSALLRTLYDRNHERQQVSVVQDNGKKVDVDLVLNPIDDKDNKTSGLILSVRDISNFKEFERFRNEFLENTAHDFGTPLSSLRLQLHMLRKNPDVLEKAIESIDAQTNRLEQLVDELRVLAEMGHRVIQLNRQMMDLNQVVNRVMQEFHSMAQEKKHDLQFIADKAIHPVYIDAMRFERIVANLIANALNYTPNGGMIRVHTEGTETTTSLIVTDNGQGISDDDLPRIFDRAFRSDTARSTNQKGRGIGLAIVKELVDAHNATIDVTSIVSQGTTFTVTLPVVQQATITDL